MLYEFGCKDCGFTIEKLMKMSDPHPTTCPNCGSGDFHKLVSSNTGFVLLGPNWSRPGLRCSTNRKK